MSTMNETYSMLTSRKQQLTKRLQQVKPSNTDRSKTISEAKHVKYADDHRQGLYGPWLEGDFRIYPLPVLVRRCRTILEKSGFSSQKLGKSESIVQSYARDYAQAAITHNLEHRATTGEHLSIWKSIGRIRRKFLRRNMLGTPTQDTLSATALRFAWSETPTNDQNRYGVNDSEIGILATARILAVADRLDKTDRQTYRLLVRGVYRYSIGNDDAITEAIRLMSKRLNLSVSQCYRRLHRLKETCRNIEIKNEHLSELEAKIEDLKRQLGE